MRVAVFTILFFLTLTSHAQQKVKVACIGNSITEGAAIEDSLRYPARLQKLLGDGYEVRNYGLGGRTLLKRGDYPYWQEEKYREALAWAPDIVVIKLGTNDSKPQNWIYADEFEGNYREFIDSFRKLRGKRRIYVCTPIPVYREEWGITESIVHNEIIPLVTRVAKSAGVKVIDLYTPMAGKSELAPDGIHPNAEGAAIIAGVVFESIR